MNSLEDENFINRLYDDLNNTRSSLVNELKNDKECLKEKQLNSKIACVDNIMKNLLKYRNLKTKEKLKPDFY
jgi:hypothetical protein